MTQQLVQTNDSYATTDLALAAAISLWYPIEEINRSQNPRKAQFIFKKHQDLDQLVNSYWRKELKVDPQLYFNQLKTIKAKLYGEM